MKHAIVAAATAAALMIGSAGTGAQTQSGVEAEPVLRASGLVGPELLKGPGFTVDERAPVKGYLARFTIRSQYGTFDARGIHMLQIRVREVGALAQLDGMSKTAQFAEAAAKAVARPVASAVNIVLNPVATVEGLPGGVARMFDRIKLGGEKIAEAASAPGKTGDEQAQLVAQRVGGITADMFGYEKERRDLAKSVGVDPYTTNPILAKKLSDMAWVAFSGRATIQAAMTVFVPGSTVMSAVTITNTSVYDTPPGDLINSARTVFAGTGASDAKVKALMGNPHYSLSVLTALAAGVQRLQGVTGLSSIVEFASIAAIEDEARFVAAAVNMLARSHESVEPLASVFAPAPILGRTRSGVLVLPAPVDYVVWSQRTVGAAQRSDLRADRRVIWLSGRLSPRAHKEISARGWRVDESFSIGAER